MDKINIDLNWFKRSLSDFATQKKPWDREYYFLITHILSEEEIENILETQMFTDYYKLTSNPGFSPSYVDSDEIKLVKYCQKYKFNYNDVYSPLFSSYLKLSRDYIKEKNKVSPDNIKLLILRTELISRHKLYKDYDRQLNHMYIKDNLSMFNNSTKKAREISLIFELSEDTKKCTMSEVARQQPQRSLSQLISFAEELITNIVKGNYPRGAVTNAKLVLLGVIYTEIISRYNYYSMSSRNSDNVIFTL